MRRWGLWLLLTCTGCSEARAAIVSARALWSARGDEEPTPAATADDATSIAAEDRAPAPAPVQTQPPWIGVVVARDVVELAAPSDGVVATLDARVGARVRAGDRIASLDATAQAAEVLAADATVARAKAELRQAELAIEGAALVRDEERGLASRGAGSRSAKAKAELEHRAAVAARARARAGVLEAEALRDVRYASLKTREIIAPFAGTIEIERTTAGAFVPRGGGVVRLVGDARSVRFVVPLTDEIPAVGTLLAWVDPTHGTRGRARVVHVAREADAAAQQLAVEADLLGESDAPPAGVRVEVGRDA